MASDEKNGVRIAGAVRGVMVHVKQPIFPSPDWDFWQSMRTVEAWQACALSLGLDPDSMPLRPPELFTIPYEYLNFERGCFPSRPVEVQFEKRLRLLDTYVRDERYFGPDSYPCLGGSSAYDKISLKDFATWAVSVMKWGDLPPPFVALARAVGNQPQLPEQESECSVVDSGTGDALSALFDPVPVAALEKMFPSGGKWKAWAGKAAANKLLVARQGRGMFNPMKAAEWFVARGVDGWDTARCHRVLAKNLPARSKDSAHLLGSDLV